ncbi:acetyl-CoA hydrolase/transferase family protein [Actinocrinis sp.]|uniref:acetyl-CoA hydrolase/transferase family protein n=1 Tax=Actinocrinis sp. TaxID=1920516 RepID=UPI002D304FD4|nr:acetyl-CoA hydrolase/transferase C-terminal domain-containing protein [Actinocrinis sp.]HZP53092.1 acetyl-CoA hydrolase/transferase C-terminal domain-containing protein [Actinocrinis sp.]
MRIVDSARLLSLLEGIAYPEPRVVASGNHATPWHLLELVDKALPQYRLFQLNSQPGIPVRDGVRHESPFVGPGMRGLPSLDYLPARLSLVPQILATTHQPDIVLLHTSAPRNGKVSLGVEVNILPAAIERTLAAGGVVVAQLNAHMPYTFGDAELPLDAIDFAVEHDVPLPSPAGLRDPSAAEIAARIGRLVAPMIEDGATLQTGIGAIPDAVLAALIEHTGLRVWSEMISDGVVELSARRALDESTPVTTSFLFGSPELYTWADRNPALHMARTETVNDPARIAAQHAMTSINTALQVDLYAQANASYARDRIYSGFGGQTDFVVGALHSRGGQAIIALPSWHAKSGTSTIVPQLCTPATSFQHTAIVTDQGRADLFGHSQRIQAEHLIEKAARPEAREHLREAAARLGIVA